MKNRFGTVEKIVLIHFLLMFGYKLFSLYIPLFLLQKSFSVVEVGYTNFLIYFAIAISAPLIGYLNHRIKPSLGVFLGILGYALYSFIMTVNSISIFWYYLAQVLLGVSGALFFVSSRVLLMKCNPKKADGSFAWFYSAPAYADAIAPVFGALIIWKFGFMEAFIVAFVIQLLTSLLSLVLLRGGIENSIKNTSFEKSIENYREVGNSIDWKKGGIFILVSFLVLIIIGFNNTFLVLFLKSLHWTDNQVLLFNSLISLAFLPISFLVAKRIDKTESEQNICIGSSIVGLFSLILGLMSSVLNYLLVSIIILSKNVGGLISNSGRSGLLSLKSKNHVEESAAVDTIFSPLSNAFGSLIGGILIAVFGYPVVFILGGLTILSFSLLGNRQR
jgi:MFS family permease